VCAGGRGDRAKVHRWYLPDSYDGWVPADSVNKDKEVRLLVRAVRFACTLVQGSAMRVC
jgi:hypothetical protein